MGIVWKCLNKTWPYHKENENHSTQVWAHGIFQLQLYIANTRTQQSAQVTFKRISSLESGGRGKGKVIFNLFSSWLALLPPIRLLTGKSRETRAGAVSIYRHRARQFAQFLAPAGTHGLPRAPILPPAPHVVGHEGPSLLQHSLPEGHLLLPTSPLN